MMKKLIEAHSKTIKEAARKAAYKYGVDADDLEQDIWVKLAEDASAALIALRDGHPYIYTIAYNMAINLNRRRRVESPADLSETTPEEDVDGSEQGPWLSETVDGAVTRPEDDVLWAETLGEVQEHVEALVAQAPDYQQSVLRAYYLDGMSYQEAADALGLAINTVSTRLARARSALGPTEGALRAWREFQYPDSRRPDLNGGRGHSGALLSILRG